MDQFSDLEGLRMAMEIENLGFEFYREAHERAINPKHKLLFSFLMQEELDHSAQFESVYKILIRNKPVNEEDYLYDPEVSRYLQILVETHIFPQRNTFIHDPKIANGVLQTGWQWQTPGQESPNELTLKAILRIALQAEKDSILFYDEMRNSAQFPEAKQIFTELKAEEQSHVEKIQKLIHSF